jgi:hypothetical protein
MRAAGEGEQWVARAGDMIAGMNLITVAAAAG